MARWLLVLLVACSGKPDAPTKPAGSATALADAITADATVAVVDPQVIAKHWPDGCFLIRDERGTIHANHPQRCATPRRPYSTFKLANALIAVDLGILAGADADMTWDKRAIPDQSDFLDVWRKPHTLRSAMQVSAVPYFRTLALQIGEERMRAGLDKLGYGNRDLGGGLDRFWLTRGALRISANEQLAFVESLARGTLKTSAHSQAVVREITELAKTSDGTRTLHGKTGSGPIEDTKGGWLVWQVGWVKIGSTIVPYAAWLESNAPELDDARAAREIRLRASLSDLAIFPQ